MGRKAKIHFDQLPKLIEDYAELRSLDYQRYSSYHLRLMDGGYTVLDVWTTGRYYVLTTDYLAMMGPGYRERGGEKGFLQLKPAELYPFLDGLFFPEEADDDDTNPHKRIERIV